MSTHSKRLQKSLLGLVVAVAGLLTCLPGMAAQSTSVTTAVEGAALTWVEEHKGNFAVFYSQYDGDQWGEPAVISANDKLNIVPTVTRGAGKEKWLAWTVFDSGTTELHFARYHRGEWTEEQTFETGLPANIAPSLLIDSQQVVWLVWAGGDGQDDDIYYTRWNGSAFEPPERIIDNSVPDVLPVLGLTADGTVWVQWKHYADAGYITMVARWDGEQWEGVTVVEESLYLQYAETITDEKEPLILDLKLPDYLQDPGKASMYVPGQEVQSVPLRLVPGMTK